MISKATFGAGCFWGVEARFRDQEGVVDAVSGYMGGDADSPAYREVCSGSTGHAEVVQVDFDDQQVSYETLLELFFDMHNPTTMNRQGPDVGSQYRSVVFTHDETQAELARAAIDRLTAEGRWPNPIVTAVEPSATFWRAEEYHQRYLEKNGLAHCPI
jgi:peptide-methionine (S)-S-oxide reductase